MSNSIRALAGDQAGGGVGIGKTVEWFRRYAFVEQSCVRALAGWFLRVERWEVKIRVGYWLFAHAERAYDIQGRLEELRGGHRDANIEPALDRLGEELAHAPDESSFLDGLACVLERLAADYREHAASADASANAMDRRVLIRLLPDVERELAEVQSVLNASESKGEERQWRIYMSGLLRSCGGIGGRGDRGGDAPVRPAGARFEWPTSIAFDERLRVADLGTYESKVSLPLRERCIGEFEVYFNEFYAAALLATIVFDSWKLSAPRQYHLDIAHHFWDEVRHAEFGAIRLRELGVEPSKINMVLFEKSQHMPLLHRLCYLTLGLEVFFMPRKPERVRYYEAQGDLRSQLLSDVDWSEEVNHVRYGKRWVDFFLQDDARTVEDVQAEITEYLSAFQSELPTGRKAPW